MSTERCQPMSIPTKEQLKARSKHLSQLLLEKYNVRVSHGHCLEVVSQLFGFKDWNTATAASPDEESTPVDSNVIDSPWMTALQEGYSISVEQPYLKEKFHVGGATAERSVERGVASLKFTPRMDQQSRRIVLMLEETKTVSTGDATVEMNRQLYLQREKIFAEKLGGKAEDLGKP
jgi:hypothetical protein